MPPRAPGLARKKGGGADERAPWCSERERGRESADRRALPRNERGKEESARAVRDRVGRVRVAGERRGAGPPTAQGQR